MVTIGLPYCYQHRATLQKLKVKNSTIPEAKKGLFAFDPTKAQGEVVFPANTTIATYVGEEITNERTDRRYGNITAPYAFQHHENRVADSALLRGVAALANHKPDDEANTRLSANANSGLLRTTQPIRNGEEIFLDYGEEYRFEDSIHSTNYVRPSRWVPFPAE